VKRVAILIGLFASALVVIVLALRIAPVRRVLTDAPGIGPVFEWLADFIHGSTAREPIAVAYGFDHPPGDLADARDRLARVTGLPTAIRGNTLVVTAGADDDAMRAFVVPRRDPIRMFFVVYQSEALDRIGRTLRGDDQAKRLGLTVELDHIGYHLHAPDDILWVNPDWAAAHHCSGDRIEGTGVACFLSPRVRLDAYVHGDPGLFIDPHPDALAVPTGFDFYVEDDGDAYELETVPIIVGPQRLEGIAVAGDEIDLALGADAATTLAGRAKATDVEVVAELAPGRLLPVTLAGPGHIAITVGADAQRAADELALAALGLHQLRDHSTGTQP
jgi:hypothetical protein